MTAGGVGTLSYEHGSIDEPAILYVLFPLLSCVLFCLPTDLNGVDWVARSWLRPLHDFTPSDLRAR